MKEGMRRWAIFKPSAPRIFRRPSKKAAAGSARRLVSLPAKHLARWVIRSAKIIIKCTVWTNAPFVGLFCRPSKSSLRAMAYFFWKNAILKWQKFFSAKRIGAFASRRWVAGFACGDLLLEGKSRQSPWGLNAPRLSGGAPIPPWRKEWKICSA